MRTRTLSIAALAVALLAAVVLSLAVRPISEVSAGYRASTPCVELVENGGFETLYSDWTIMGGAFPADYTQDEEHTGVRSMRLGIPPAYSDRWAYSSIYQDVTIPSGVESASLSFWFKPQSTDSSGLDVQRMWLTQTSGHRQSLL